MITLLQFLFVAGQTLPSQLTFRTTREVKVGGDIKEVERKTWLPRLKKRQVPIKRWLVQVVLFFVSLCLYVIHPSCLKCPLVLTSASLLRIGRQLAQQLRLRLPCEWDAQRLL